MKSVVIFGSGGHAHVIADIVLARGDKVIAFLDDNKLQSDCSGPISQFSKYRECEFVIGIGSAEKREELSRLNLSWYTAIHPSAVISNSAKIGAGTVVMPNAVVNARATIGNHCIINTGAIVEHDNQIGDYAHISVGAKLGGNVRIGEKSWIGIGSCIKNNLDVCDNVVIGAGAVIIDSITMSGTYVGVPARMIEKNK